MAGPTGSTGRGGVHAAVAPSATPADTAHQVDSEPLPPPRRRRGSRRTARGRSDRARRRRRRPQRRLATDGDTMTTMATRTDTQSPALHVADSHDLIRVQGARVNNLK